MLREQMNQTRGYVHAKQKNINVQDIFTPLLSINADIKTIILSVGLFLSNAFPSENRSFLKMF